MPTSKVTIWYNDREPEMVLNNVIRESIEDRVINITTSSLEHYYIPIERIKMIKSESEN